MAFTEADAKKLKELQEKQRKAKQEERNEQKRNDRFCKKLFGVSEKELRQKLATCERDTYWYSSYKEYEDLANRLMATVNGNFSFREYVEYRERKASEKNL